MLTLRQLARLSVLAMAGLLTLSASAATQTMKPNELVSLLENAATKADHLKLAGHYAAEAEEFRQDASSHDSMAGRYKKLPRKTGAGGHGMVKHCERLATSLRNAAEAADQLAKAHREMAESAK